MEKEEINTKDWDYLMSKIKPTPLWIIILQNLVILAFAIGVISITAILVKYAVTGWCS